MFIRRESISRRAGSVSHWVLWAGFAVLLGFGSVLPVLDGAPQDQANPPQTLSKAEKKRQKQIQKELETPYKKWLDEEVPYIITATGKSGFQEVEYGR